jgi:hypothetical protein
MRIAVRALLALAVGVALLCAAPLAVAQDGPLTNADVVKLVKLDLGDDVVVAKIKGAPAVKFDTGADALASLKQEGVSKAVITAMVERSSAPAPAAVAMPVASGPGVANVTLRVAGQDLPIQMVEGSMISFVAPFVGHRRVMQFDGLRADARVRDRRPSVTAAVPTDPSKRWWFVKLDQDDDDKDRSIDVESPGLWGGKMSAKPDEDVQVPYDAVQEQPGLWRLTPRKDLKPGEYGFYTSDGERGFLYGFGIDK